MTLYTARGYPKPEASDLISDGWDAIGDLADALDSELGVLDTRTDAAEAAIAAGFADTGWIALAFANGWGNYGGGWATGAYRKIGDQVFLKGLVTGGTLGAAIATLPAGYRPPELTMLVASVAGVPLTSYGYSDTASNDSGLPTNNTTGSSSGHSHSMSNHRHSVGHYHPTVTVAGNIGQIGVRLDVSTTGAITASGANSVAWQALWGSFFTN